MDSDIVGASLGWSNEISADGSRLRRGRGVCGRACFAFEREDE